MKMYDIVVVGSGIGGTLFASLNHQKHELLLFEKDTNLGGCCSTFKRFGNYYNTGATTFVGYEEGHLIKRIFDEVRYKPNLIHSKIGVRIIQEKTIVDRVQDFEDFVASIDKEYPNSNNRIFWRTIKEIDEKFWQLKKLYYAKNSLSAYSKSMACLAELFTVYKSQLFMSADAFIKKTLGNISSEYQEFIDAQLLITLQTKSKDLSLLTMALGLAYTFHKTYYVQGGMGSMIEGLLENIPHKKNEGIMKIIRHKAYYELHSEKEVYKAKNVVLNSTIYQSAKLFEEESIIKYYQKFKFSDQSAFVLYLKVKSKADFLHHYQIILKENIPNSISNAFFVSFSDKSDEKLSKEGYSVTISTHTKAKMWKNLSKEDYKHQKSVTENHIKEAFLNYFDTIHEDDITKAFSATSKTFNHYIGRHNCGGEALKMKNIFSIPPCTTPFKGLYNIGDTVFAGQGWPGVALGVDVLNKEFNHG
ncbi:MAG: Phytoene dehydrogenase and related proteins-like [uncultured Sulfurovum sp.]|uniref:Phytoene dehydrogenase and related proteins-like n=1 Tax=uncultured Sulfurovum sp. TaxID=269237 RepID=A0A6S6SWA5_9BACT|nr:MAG: Phytoene dehydrogenase and related proteins-like [uncultured Sulfurovum sp.]